MRALEPLDGGTSALAEAQRLALALVTQLLGFSTWSAAAVSASWRVGDVDNFVSHSNITSPRADVPLYVAVPNPKWCREAGVLPIADGEASVGLLTTTEVGGFDAAAVKAQIVATLGI
ncbi:MAG TPA: hypothetical protein VGL35_11520 [Rhizomicrobium sp.]|jgi:hypothetical protein